MTRSVDSDFGDAPTQALLHGDGDPSPAELEQGTQVGDYVIVVLLGRGGYGSVYAATHRATGRQVALKFLRREMASPAGLERFRREVQALRSLRHPAIVEVSELTTPPDGSPYYAMELLRGATLRERLHERGPMAPTEALAILEPVCSALAAAHAIGLVHRDLKAENIHIDDSEGSLHVKLLDFGIAKLVGPELDAPGLTTTGVLMGTPAVAAPEQIRGEPVDARTDVYAFGVLLHQMLTGSYPFLGTTVVEIISQHLNSPAPPPGRLVPLPPALDAVVLRCMEKRPEARFQTIGDALAAVRAAVGVARPAGERREAVALYVQIHGPDDDDAAVDDAMAALELAEATLARWGLQVVLSTSSELLAVHLVAAEAPEEMALRLGATLAERPDADPRVHVSVQGRRDGVQVEPRGAGEVAVGGPLLDLKGWTRS